MYPTVISLKRDSFDLWNRASSTGALLNPISTLSRQLQKEAEVDNLMDDVDSEVRRARQHSNRSTRRRFVEIRGRIQRAIVQLLHSFDCVIDPAMETRFSSVTDEFIRAAYDFDPRIGDEPLYQAARNVLIMNTLQMHLDRDISLTPSVFAYSMLYPYTDNYIDRVDLNTGAKQDANHWLMLRLKGCSVRPRNPHEKIIDRLVSMIEREFCRESHPSVFESLLAIHHAQTLSVSQTDNTLLPPDRLLDISIEKGGASVLADGYLVAGLLSDGDARFLFRFGVLLQLIDDLQDIKEDYRSSQRTLVGVLAARNSLDEFTNHLLSYLETVVGPAAEVQAEVDPKLQRLIERSCRLLVFEAIAMNETCYSSQYIAMMEHHSPVRFSYLRGVNERLRKTRRSQRAASGARMKNGNTLSRGNVLRHIG